jgi:hypothetical protein
MFGGAGNDILNGYSWVGTNSVEYDSMTGGFDADTFVLGDANRVFYQGEGYATITDFDWREGDKIQVHGRQGYTLGSGNYVGTTDRDTLLYYNNDLIAVIQDTTDVNLANDFTFI